jgi:hypothetical protein
MLLLETIPLLVNLASASSSNSRLSELEKETIAISERLWDITTKPHIDADDSGMKSMKDILPYFPHGHLAELLPTSMQPDRLQGVLFRGDDRRKIEFIGVDPNLGLGRPRSYISRAPSQLTEFVIFANAPVPASVPEYYFEMTIDQVNKLLINEEK